MRKKPTLLSLIVLGSVFAGAFLQHASNGLAQDTPRAFLASPEIYKVIGETGHYRVIAASWKPGERDHWHSRASAGVLYLTDCRLRRFSPDGTSREAQTAAGTRGVNEAVSSQSLQNVGTSQCRLVLIEEK